MGQRSSQFTEQELQDYEDLTYFTKREVLVAHRKFKALAPEKVGHNKNAKLPMSKMFQYPELKVNPFRDRICKIFSSSQDGDCTFEDFLDMMSVFCEKAPRSVKAEHAFRIYDFDGDDMLGVNDLRQVIERLTGSEQSLNEENMQHLIQNILDEADLDDDGALSFAEFEHVVSKSPDFTRYLEKNHFRGVKFRESRLQAEEPENTFYVPGLPRDDNSGPFANEISEEVVRDWTKPVPRFPSTFHAQNFVSFHPVNRHADLQYLPIESIKSTSNVFRMRI